MDTEEEALADVAYGLFEVFLNKELHKQGHQLFELVENRTEFSEEFTGIFASFSTEYPLLADALKDEYGSADAIYSLFTGGEGVIPTKTTKIFWIFHDAPECEPGCVNAENAGKWLIFLEPGHADAIWKKIRDATAAGELGISTKVSTAKQSQESRDDRMVIYVYTRDWEDEEDVMRIREVLRSLGVTDRIGYKRNIETFQGEYSEKGKKVTYYTA
ncbi:putative phosphothreonine lyase domain-containing protein [Methanogenium cariaci]|jgi:Bles03-like protein